MLVSSKVFSSNVFQVSGFELDHRLIEKIKFWEDIKISHVYFGEKRWSRRSDGWFYSSDYSLNLVGDLRARFSGVFSNIHLTVLAAQCGQLLIPFTFDPRIFEVVAESGAALVKQFISPAIAELIVVFASGIEANVGKVEMSLSFVSKDHRTISAVFQQLHSTERRRRMLEVVVALSLIGFAACHLGLDLTRSKSKKYNQNS